MPEITCSRCGLLKTQMEQPPLPGKWGLAAQREACVDCWRDWVEEQTRLINHERLTPADPAQRAILYRHMHTYLHLASIDSPD